MGCKRCGTDHCSPLRRNDISGIQAYWFASLKDTEDFLILMSNLQVKYFTSSKANFPSEKDLLEKWDWFCTDCYLILENQKKISTRDWVRP